MLNEELRLSQIMSSCASVMKQKNEILVADGHNHIINTHTHRLDTFCEIIFAAANTFKIDCCAIQPAAYGKQAKYSINSIAMRRMRWNEKMYCE